MFYKILKRVLEIENKEIEEKIKRAGCGWYVFTVAESKLAGMERKKKKDKQGLT